MNRFFTSDWHLGHFNVINYCNRPYKTIEEMNAAIIEIVNSTVKAEDELYLIGDASLNPKWIEAAMKEIKCQNIFLIIGNHDSCFEKKLGAKKEKTLKMRKRYFEAGFKSLKTEMWLKLGDKYNVQLCHFPFAPKPGDGTNGDVRYMNERPIDKGQILLCGHSHAYFRKNGRVIDVGFDGDLKVWSEKEIIELIEDPRDYIESPLTNFYKNRKNENPSY